MQRILGKSFLLPISRLVYTVYIFYITNETWFHFFDNFSLPSGQLTCSFWLIAEGLKSLERRRKKGKGQRLNPVSSSFSPLHFRSLWLISEFPPPPSTFHQIIAPQMYCWTFSLVVPSCSEITGNADFIRVFSTKLFNCWCPLASAVSFSMLHSILPTPHPSNFPFFFFLNSSFCLV